MEHHKPRWSWPSDLSTRLLPQRLQHGRDGARTNHGRLKPGLGRFESANITKVYIAELVIARQDHPAWDAAQLHRKTLVGARAVNTWLGDARAVERNPMG
jgi:hypothetical protein